MQQQLGKRKRREESGITEKPDSDLLCFICNSIIQNAASVPCGHSYCRSCIVLHIESTPSCPQCSHPLSLNEIFPNLLLQKLIQRSNPSLKPTFSIQSHVNYELLLKFLRISKDKKLSELNSLNSQLEILDTDIGMVSTRLNTARKAANENKTPKETSVPENKVDVIKIEPSVPAVVNDDRITVLVDKQYNRINQHFNDLQDYYFSLHKDTDQVQRSGIEFSDTFSKFSKYSRIKTLANLHYADSFFNGSNSIVSSIEFDKDDEFFATAGTRKSLLVLR